MDLGNQEAAEMKLVEKMAEMAELLLPHPRRRRSRRLWIRRYGSRRRSRCARSSVISTPTASSSTEGKKPPIIGGIVALIAGIVLLLSFSSSACYPRRPTRHHHNHNHPYLLTHNPNFKSWLTAHTATPESSSEASVTDTTNTATKTVTRQDTSSPSPIRSHPNNSTKWWKQPDWVPAPNATKPAPRSTSTKHTKSGPCSF